MVMLLETGHDPVILCMRVGSFTRKCSSSCDQNDAGNVKQTGPSVQGTEKKSHERQTAVIEPRTYRQKKTRSVIQSSPLCIKNREKGTCSS